MKPRMRVLDSVVVGAGPAGLSAAAQLTRVGSCLLVDQGPEAPARRRDDASDLLSGVGGAGLFSDGKHSFFPSATALWTLPDAAALGAAFGETAALLRRYGVEAGPLPANAPATVPAGVWHEKPYPSLYVSFEKRLRCIEELWASAGERLSRARVTGATRTADGIVVSIEHDGAQEEILARRLILGTGRWSSRWTRRWLEPLGARFAFGRVEFGVRIEADAASPFFARLPGIDGKLRFVEPGERTEYRTFCTCREGEVVLGMSEGLRAYSGRADGPKSGRSNVGLMVRTTDEALGRDVLRALESSSPASFPLAEWLDAGASHTAATFGERGAAALWRGLLRLLEWAPELRAGGARVHLPCIEGIGDYPVADDSLRIAPETWVAGDAGGRFRGIVASMVSGRYAAIRAATS